MVNQNLDNLICFIPIEKASKGSMNVYYGDNPKPQQNYYKDFLEIR